MFVRQKKNKSGTISVQIIDKSSGNYKVVKTIGIAFGEEDLKELLNAGQEYIHSQIGQHNIDFDLGDDMHFYQSVYENLQSIYLLGPELVLGKLFDEVGFNKIKDTLFRDLVISRLIYPASKLKTIDYLIKYKGIVYEKDQVYRYLDKLHKEQIARVQEISYTHTIKILQADISVVFYDVTTLYFEAEDEDDLRKTGFSKDGKHQQPQILLGLLVSAGGYPLDYEIFEGNTFEGHTMLSVVESFKKKHDLQQLIIVADAGLMSTNNISQLIEKGYEFIIGARIKNESQALQNQILSQKLKDGESIALSKTENLRLILSYSESRAKNDEHNRTRGLNKLEKALKRGKLTKQHINNKGYNKYLVLKGEIQIEIDYAKFSADKKWDGLKGYITNTNLDKQVIIEHYKQLCQIEKTFRISKTDLRIRPIYHQKKRRIEAHICIAFAACKIYKELERQLKQNKSELSPEKAIEILKTIYGINLKLPQSQIVKQMLLDKTMEQKLILRLFKII